MENSGLNKKKILVVTTRFPFDLHGACEQDRAQGIRFLVNLGYEVSVITMCYPRFLEKISTAEKEWGVTITPVLYSKERLTRSQRFLKRAEQIIFPLLWDGAAYEYRDKEIQQAVKTRIGSFKPDLVWFDYTYLWPLYHIAQKARIPIITRSINYEPAHFLGKTKKNLFDYLKYLIKAHGERKMLKGSDFIFSITPKELLMYQQLGAEHITNLPLRRLSQLIGKNTKISTREKLNVIFMGSNFTVHHMNMGLRFIVDKVNPLLQKRYPNTFTIHIIGGKVPSDLTSTPREGLQFHGYVPDLDQFLGDMDIALSPSLSGEGMQQKVFEPIVRGIPTVTSARALSGYPFSDGVHVILAQDTPESFVASLASLRDHTERTRISQNAVGMAACQFNEALITELMDRNIKKLLA